MIARIYWVLVDSSNIGKRRKTGESETFNAVVIGSNPIRPTIKYKGLRHCKPFFVSGLRKFLRNFLQPITRFSRVMGRVSLSFSTALINSLMSAGESWMVMSPCSMVQQHLRRLQRGAPGELCQPDPAITAEEPGLLDKISAAMGKTKARRSGFASEQQSTGPSTIYRIESGRCV